MDIIVSHSYGSFDAYEATVANAKEILSWQTIPAEVKEFAENKPERWTTTEMIERIIKKMLDKEIGEEAFRSKDDSVVIPITAEAKAETVLYLYQKGIAPKEFSSYTLKTKCKIEDLSWLSHFHEITLIDEWVSDQASKLRCINKETWKEGVAEVKKIDYILRFVNELCHRDERYEVVPVKDSAK